MPSHYFVGGIHLAFNYSFVADFLIYASSSTCKTIFTATYIGFSAPFFKASDVCFHARGFSSMFPSIVRVALINGALGAAFLKALK